MIFRSLFLSLALFGFFGNLFGPQMESGLLLREFPYVKAGKGPSTLVIFPALVDALYDARAMPSWQKNFLRYYSKEGTVYIISRKKNLPEDTSIADMAKDYARIFEKVTGPAHVMGISMGGYIAQQFALDYPQHVKSLILGVSAHRFSPQAAETGERWVKWTHEKKWVKMFHDMNDKTYTGHHRLWNKFVVIPILGLIAEKPVDPRDFLVCMKATREFDLGEKISKIQAPTLVIGGKKDFFFPEPILREAAEKIPHAKLVILKGVGHGAFQEKKRQFDRAVLDFIRENEAK